MRILHIEDDPDLKKWIKQGLVRGGFAVDGASDAEMGLQLAKESDYDLILMDLGLPGKSGREELKQLRAVGIKSIIFIISGQGGEQEKVMAVTDGADDYMVKPILIAELVARIRTRLRGKEETNTTELTAGDLRMNLLNRRVTVKGRVITLRPKEFSLLEYLLRNKGRVVSQTAIAQAVWSLDEETQTNVVEQHIKNLRKKIDEEGQPSIIQTHLGAGYMIEDETPGNGR